MKKIILKTIIIILILLGVTQLKVGATTFENTQNNTTFEMELKTQIQTLKPGEQFEVNANIKDIKNIEKGIISIAGQLEYNKDILQVIEVEDKILVGQNGWNLDTINESNFKFVADNSDFITEAGEIFKIKFKVKDTLSQEVKTAIKIVQISASGGNGIIETNDVQIDIDIRLEQEPSNPDDGKITSNKYIIDSQYISRITPGTTVNQFKQNIETNQKIEIIDKNGKVLEQDNLIGTGMILKVGSTSQYIISVTGDIDGDARITVNDLAKLKLHYVGIELLTGINLKSADLDNNGRITINDVSKIKLVLVELIKIE